MKTIYFLTDYLNRFGSKHFDSPYRSGMSKEVLHAEFAKHNVEIRFIPLFDVFKKVPSISGRIFLYTSSEDKGYQYKSFIEDIVFLLENAGGIVIPFYKYLRANNNKVFMEGLRLNIADPAYKTIISTFYGTLEELKNDVSNLKFPVVIKTAEGASGSGVFKASDPTELLSLVKRVSRTPHLAYELKEALRPYKHKGYMPESRHRKKFIIQNFIPGLKNDWKVYYFGDKYYVFYRPVFKHRGFRASGGGYDNYFYGENASAPNGIFDFVKKLTAILKIPQASLDIAHDGERFHLFEMQFLYFGTAGIQYSEGYYQEKEGKWEFVKEKLTVEKVYVESIIRYLEQNK